MVSVQKEGFEMAGKGSNDLVKAFNALGTYQIGKGKVYNLTPLGWYIWLRDRADRLIPCVNLLGHIQGVAVCGKYLVLTSNQETGYVALCEKVANKGKYVYEYRSHLGELDVGSPMNQHPGGVQIFKDDGKFYAVVPFETDMGGKMSQIRFYQIKQGEGIPKLVGPILVVNRDGKKAGSVGIASTGQPGKFILAVADDDNQVDFYKICLRGGKSPDTDVPFASWPKNVSSIKNVGRIKFVNSFSLLRNGSSYYLLGLEGVLNKWRIWKKEKDRACLYEIDLSDKRVKEVRRSKIVCFGKDVGKGLSDPSFRWGGNSILNRKYDELSLVAIDRSVGGGRKGNANIKIVRPKKPSPRPSVIHRLKTLLKLPA